MKKIVLLCLIFISGIQATILRFFNNVEPKQLIWVGTSKADLTKIQTSQIFSKTPIKEILWTDSEDGTLYSQEVQWSDADIVHVYVYKDLIQVGTATGQINKTVKNITAHVVQAGKQAVEDIKGFSSDVVQKLAGPIKDVVKREQLAVKESPYNTTVATVRQGRNLNDQEFKFRQKRLPLVKKKQEEILGTTFASDEAPLEIAFAFSGGGLRAMYSALGSLSALQMLGLTDTAMTISALSGSTWAVFPWLSVDPRKNNEPMSVQAFLNTMLPRFSAGLLLSLSPAQHLGEVKAITDMLLVKFAFDQPVNAVIDLYGGLLANKLFSHFGNDRQRVHISDIRFALRSGRYPMPVGTAVYSSVMKTQKDDWFEVTPYECGSRWLGYGGAYVPTWSFGRHFTNGQSTDFAPEQSEGFFCGVFGSAPAANFREVYDGMIKDMNILDVLKKSLKWMLDTELGTIRLVWGEVYNPFRGVIEGHYGAQNTVHLRLIDAGVDFGCPVFATYRKTTEASPAPVHGGAPDIIFVFDNSSTVGADELYKQAAYAAKHNLKYPIKPEAFERKGTKWVFKNLQLQELVTKRVINVFEDTGDATVPVVVYITRIVDDATVHYAVFDPEGEHAITKFKNMIAESVEEEYSTFNLIYTAERAERLSKLAHYNVLGVKSVLKEVMNKKLARNRAARSFGSAPA